MSSHQIELHVHTVENASLGIILCNPISVADVLITNMVMMIRDNVSVLPRDSIHCLQNLREQQKERL